MFPILSLVAGKSDGLWVLHHADGRVEEVAYANGRMSDRKDPYEHGDRL